MQKFSYRYLVMVVQLLFFSVGGLFSQVNHFVYLQSDNQQPFYIKFNGRIISSTASGYIILSKLKDGDIEFQLGFPKSSSVEQTFLLKVDKMEKGFLIKEFPQKGWGLFDLQTAAITYASVAPLQASADSSALTAAKPADDPFANMLSTVTSDSTVKNVTVKKEEKVVKMDTPEVVIQEEPKKNLPVDTIQTKPQPVKEQKPIIELPVVKKDSIAAVAVVQEPVFTAPPKSSIKQVRKFESREGVDCVFEVVEQGDIKDTVRIFIAGDTSVLKLPDTIKQAEIIPATIAPPVDTVVQKNEPKPEIKPESKTVISVTPKEEVKVQQTMPEPVKQTPTPVTQPVTSIPNSNCKEQAGDEDFLKLRKRMAAQSKEESMVIEAKKTFKQKCFSTAQLKNLAPLFLTDEWRYRFYDAALPFVNDFSNFKSLGETIADEYYRKRFQALLPTQ